MGTESYTQQLQLETSDGAGTLASMTSAEGPTGESVDTDWYMPYPISFQVSLTCFLLVELVLGFSSNLTVLVLYCSQSNLVDSVSNMVTVNLHVLDIVVCVLCLPLTIVIVLLPVGRNLELICCFHEACVTFASISTAINVLVISLDRYDISVRPANRFLTPRWAALLLAAVWAVSLAVFFIPFIEVDFFSSEPENGLASSSLAPAWRNRTLLCVGGQGYYTAFRMYYHILLQMPIFFITVVVMLFTYSRILRALNIRIGSHMRRSQRRSGATYKGRQRKRKKKGGPADIEGGGQTTTQNKQMTHPPLIPTVPTPTATSPPPLSSTPLVSASTAAPPAPAVGVQASVSAIIALRRAVRRHRDRRERQRRVFRMSLIIICSFLGCWAPISVANILIVTLGPSDTLVRVRLWFLALAYGTTISHPMLYAFTRQKLRRALRAKVKKRVVSLLQVDPSPGGTVIHNSWVEPRHGRNKRQREAKRRQTNRETFFWSQSVCLFCLLFDRPRLSCP
ncbi:putative G-protein coupled receptor 22 [Bagarius yarrelli]|uniref:G-protein coupled receptor 22 n=1 Tax=Bagarius yarrelli TaxID=175774 RepID=A0A556VY60_BAGYA|nr:putative G-protein coupled receptor 22 [Bagarius yarrelli]